MTTSLERVTRSAAAKVAADLPPNDIEPPRQRSRHQPTSEDQNRATSTRKRKASTFEQTPQSPKEQRRKKRSKVEQKEEVEEPAPLLTKHTKRKSATMSSTGQSSSNEAETSPQNLPRDSVKKKSHRRNKDEQSSSASAPLSRKSRRGSRKDHDTIMKDSEAAKAAESAQEEEVAEPPRRDANAGADGPEESLRRFTEDVMGGSGMGDPFSGGYLSRLVGHSGLAGLSGHLRALSGMSSGAGGRLRSILEQLRMKEDPSMQLIALQELSELLLVSNEDNLAGQFAPDQFVKELVSLMSPNEITGEENPEMMLLACRCIANLMEALPAATASVVYGGAVPILCQKLLEIHFIDLAEQALSTLEKISVEFPASIVREGGLTACLTYLEFFATSTQRTAVTTAANCCRNIPEDSFPTVRDVMPILLQTLSSNDQRVVEQASLCVSRIVDSFKYTESKLEELVSTDLLQAILRLLLPGSTNMISPHIHTSFLRVLSITARASPRLSVELLKMSLVDTLYQILTGVSPPSDSELNLPTKIDKNVIMQAIIRTPREQVFETLNVICEILPAVSREDLMFLDDLQDAGYTGPNPVSMSTRSKKSPNDKRLELLKECPAEVKRFTVILFPTLMHAYTSTVNLAVRQKVLTAQLKMLSTFDTDILLEALRGVAYSSHLASILSQQDNPMLITYALQAAELLLKRLESIFRGQFYREGVTAEIEKLASQPLTSPSIAIKEKALEAEESVQVAVPVEDDEQHDTMELDPAAAMHETGGDTEPDDDEDDQEEHDEDEEEHVNDEDDDDENDEHDDDQSEVSEPQSDGQNGGPRHTNIHDLVTLRAKRFMEVHQPESNKELHTKAASILEDLQSLAAELSSCYHARESSGVALYQRLGKYFSDDSLQSITSYELMTSGVVDTLLEVLNGSDTGEQARKDFIKVFMSSRTGDTGEEVSASTAFSILLRKLQELLSRNEHFEVITVNQNAFESNRTGAASMLAKQLRLQLVADDSSGIPKTYRRIIVSIHAIATFKALDDYLRPRLSMVEKTKVDAREQRLSSGMAAYTAAMAGQAGLPPPLPSFADASSLPSRSSVSRKSRKPRASAASPEQLPQTPNEDKSQRRPSRRSSVPSAASKPSATDLSDKTAMNDASQDPIECADETHISDDERQEIQAELDAILDDGESAYQERDDTEDPTAVNLEIGNTGKVHARTDDGSRISTPSQHGTPIPAVARDRLMEAHARFAAAREFLGTPSGGPSRAMSYASALQSVPQDWHIEFSINGERITNDTTIYRACYSSLNQIDAAASRGIWSATHTISYKRVDGPPSADSSLSASSDNLRVDDKNDLPPSLTQHPMTARILRLMSILHELNANIDEILMEKPRELTVEPLARFVNAKLTAKLNRQLEEPLIVASNCLPTWSEDLARLYGFLFPFETRHLFLSSTSFGYSRSMTRWQNAQTDEGRRGRHRDERPFLGRLQRQKVRISRHRILESAIKVMEMYGSSPSVLEVEYFEEVGTGLGPTLEFYSTVSKEFSKKKTKLWRENESQTGDFAFGRKGLFPAPMTEKSSKTETGQRVLHLFKMLGKFVARSMLDSRIIDVSFNPAFFRFGADNAILSIAAVASVDQDLARSLKALQSFSDAKQQIEHSGISKAAQTQKVANIRVNDAKLDDLALDFTLPGYEKLELIENGSNIAVTMDNLDDYIEKVVDLTLGSGIRRQVKAFAAGFNQVFPFDALQAFTPDELVMLFGRTSEDWTLETLMDSIKADHGYNLDSKSVRNLLHVMSELTEEEKRAFLQFVTGSPKLPIGGFKSLTPMFTVVCKPAEAPLTSDDYLPSVMTCVNYLKMPDYSTIEVLKAKLHTAVHEGQGSFHLS
ncbi:hypothetical protein AMS68_007461 [Peltaster fructicola]|uniref:HECT-type E3 ubiquitin transferase n=1 Tax=Peltaster fructicola TaxID=286661 RepID=A0A6H0Y4K3_9PEZI|nr:hypothetical protein AMS68_007461 [Peltaster fructicola]